MGLILNIYKWFWLEGHLTVSMCWISHLFSLELSMDKDDPSYYSGPSANLSLCCHHLLEAMRPYRTTCRRESSLKCVAEVARCSWWARDDFVSLCYSFVYSSIQLPDFSVDRTHFTQVISVLPHCASLGICKQLLRVSWLMLPKCKLSAKKYNSVFLIGITLKMII